MKILILALTLTTMAFGAFAACQDLQKAERIIVSIAYHGGDKAELVDFCKTINKAIKSEVGLKIGLDGLLMGSLEFCIQGTNMDVRYLAREVSLAIKEIKGCYRRIGQ